MWKEWVFYINLNPNLIFNNNNNNNNNNNGNSYRCSRSSYCFEYDGEQIHKRKSDHAVFVTKTLKMYILDRIVMVVALVVFVMDFFSYL